MARWLSEEDLSGWDIDYLCDLIISGEPLQYIFGHTDWRGLRLEVNPSTLIPRPETAELVDQAGRLPSANESLRVLDIGTGSGCIAIALKLDHPDWDVWACDISPEALEVARRNAEANGATIHFVQADILSPHPFSSDVPSSFDLVVSNPPYICLEEQSEMEPVVLEHEPHSALFVPDDDPLLFYRAIARLHMAPALLYEINRRFGPATAAMLQAEGYPNTTIYQDLCGNDRIVSASVN